MNWKHLSRELCLSAADEAHARRLLEELQHQFADMCSRNWADRDDSPLEDMARYIVEAQADYGAASAYLLQLLQQPEANGATRFAEGLEAERRTREGIEGRLTSAQLNMWKKAAPESLLEIDVGVHPFMDALEKRVEELHHPEGFLCTTPFEYAHIQANGDVYPCCPSKFGKIIGNLRRNTLEEIWRSPEAIETRESMVDGSYRFCNAQACEYLRDAKARGKPLSPVPLVRWAEREKLLDAQQMPKVVNFGFDRTCNLSCNYCRAEIFRPKPLELEIIRNIDANIFESNLGRLERIILLGEGDPFASPFYRDKLQHYEWSRHPKLRIKIQSNGLLLTPSMWKSIERSHCAIDWISISVDACAPETYKINRNGDFNLLLRNLEFIADLRAAGAINQFYINFLVQANNFEEMPAFASLGKRLGCDIIEFQRLENWGTYTEHEYRERAVHESFHPRHQDFLRVIRDPELQHSAVWLLKLSDCLPGTASVDVHVL